MGGTCGLLLSHCNNRYQPPTLFSWPIGTLQDSQLQ